MVTLEELQKSTAQVGCLFHKSGLYGRVAGKKPLLKEKHLEEGACLLLKKTSKPLDTLPVSAALNP